MKSCIPQDDFVELLCHTSYRKQLRTLFDNVAVLDRELVLNRVRDLVNMTLPRWQTSSFAEVEAALTFLYQLGEALPVSHGNHFSGDSVCFLFYF